MQTASFAVQPTAWINFDQFGCDWATDINHAYSIARAKGEECIIWRVPNSGGAPMRWIRCNDETPEAI